MTELVITEFTVILKRLHNYSIQLLVLAKILVIGDWLIIKMVIGDQDNHGDWWSASLIPRHSDAT